MCGNPGITIGVYRPDDVPISTKIDPRKIRLPRTCHDVLKSRDLITKIVQPLEKRIGVRINTNLLIETKEHIAER